MTKEERSNPDVINPSRKQRIAKGAGVDISQVNKLVKQFEQARKMMKSMPGLMGGKGKKKTQKNRSECRSGTGADRGENPGTDR